MKRNERPRVDWMPGAAALEALAVAEALFPNLGRQELVDRLVITGLAALRQPPLPPLLGSNRDAWRLPPELRLREVVPGNCTSPDASLPGSRAEPSRERLPLRAGSRKVAA